MARRILPICKETWRHRIDAVEAFSSYITPVYEYVYDEVFVGDATEIVPRLSRLYDLVLLIDVLEHIDRQQGEELLKVLRIKSRVILISLPRKVRPQGAIFGNPYEVHRSEWTRQELLEFGPCSFLVCREKLICIMGEAGVRMWKAHCKRRLRKILRKRLPILAVLHGQITRLTKGLSALRQ